MVDGIGDTAILWIDTTDDKMIRNLYFSLEKVIETTTCILFIAAQSPNSIQFSTLLYLIFRFWSHAHTHKHSQLKSWNTLNMFRDLLILEKCSLSYCVAFYITRKRICFILFGFLLFFSSLCVFAMLNY